MTEKSKPWPEQGIDISSLIANSIGWIQNHSAAIFLSISVGLTIYFFLRVARRWARRFGEKSEHIPGFASLIGNTFARTTHFFMVFAAARVVATYANPPSFLLRTIIFLFTVAAVFQGAIWAREFILGIIERRSKAEGAGENIASALGIIRVLITFALFAIALIVVLDNLGVNVTGLVAGLGIGGIAIGLAAQGIFSDLFAALSIIFDKPFKTGDAIQYDQTIGTVEHIGLKSTHVRALTGERKVISNAALLQKEITNYAHIARRRISFNLGIIYQTPPGKAAQVPEIARLAIEAHGGQMVRTAFTGFGVSSLDYECIFELVEPNVDIASMIRQKIGLEILQRFADEGLEFAYPTQTTFTAAPNGEMIMPYPNYYENERSRTPNIARE